MKRKEFKEHQWKEGEIIYRVVSRFYGYFDIPAKVIRMKVKDVNDKLFYVEPCNKKDKDLIRSCGCWYTVSSRVTCSDIFFTKREADEEFERKCDEFKRGHADWIYRKLIEKLNELDAEKQKVWGIMRMKIFNQNT